MKPKLKTKWELEKRLAWRRKEREESERRGRRFSAKFFSWLLLGF